MNHSGTCQHTQITPMISGDAQLLTFFQQDGLHGAAPAQFLVSAKEGSRLQKYDEKNGDRRGASGNGVQQPVGAEKEKGKFQRGKQEQIPDFPLFMGRKKCPQLFP